MVQRTILIILFIAALVLGGHGVKVGPEPSEARYRLGSVQAVHEWLEASLTALGAGDEP